MRAYEGINLSSIKDRNVLEALRITHNFLLDVGPAIKALQDAAAGGGGGGGAPTSAPFVTIGNVAALSAERALAAASPITLSDSGPDASVSIGLSASALAAIIGGTPAVTFGTGYLAGTAITFVRTDAQLKFPTSLLSAANGQTLTFTDDGVDTFLTSSLGILTIQPADTLTINIPASSSGNAVSLLVDSTTAPAVTLGLQGRIAAGTRTIVNPSFFAGAFATTASETLRCWNASMPLTTTAQMGSSAGGFDATIVASDAAIALTPAAGSGSANEVYGFRTLNFLINNANASWDDAAGGYFKGPSRTISGTPTIITPAALILEPARIGNTIQYGLIIRQQTGAAQVNATDRVAIEVLEQNSGTNRYAARFFNQVVVSNPSGRAETALNLRQLNTGANVGAHINFDNKAGDGTPVAGDLWRNADELKFRNSTVANSLVQLAGQLGGTGAVPDVRGLRETGGPTLLTIGAIVDGEFLKRSGSTIISASVAGGSSEFADNVFRIIGSGDATKKLAFEVDGITTGTTRTVTARNFSGSDVLATIASLATDLLDDNGVAALRYTGIASSVNRLNLKSSVTGSPVEITAAGTDSNIDILLNCIGTTGRVNAISGGNSSSEVATRSMIGPLASLLFAGAMAA